MVNVPEARAACEIAGEIVALQIIAPPGSTKLGTHVPCIVPLPLMFTLILGLITEYGLVFEISAASFESDAEEPRIRSWQYGPDWNEHEDGTTPEGAKTN